MNPVLGWTLALMALAAGWLGYGWPGVAMAVTVIAFWLILQFNRAVRVMRNANDTPVGHVVSVVMLNSKLKVGMPMLQVVGMTRSLGKKVAGRAETYLWTDAGGLELVVTFDNGRCKRWQLNRPEQMEVREAA
ncbi:MAG: hypothetical protein AD742_01890 [Methylibium sp. NZG]|nr:MAG: hypothetical protein AD742_01890 [Methylibium sp. NZG]